MTGKRLITKDEFDLYVANLNQRLAGMGISPTGSGGGDIEAHNILSATHNDTTMAACVRGDILIGNVTPNWARLAKGAANTFLGSDGADPSYRTAAQVLASLSAEAGAAFDWNAQNLTNVGTIGAATGSTIGNLTLANGSITDSSGAISFGNENLSTTGTLGCGGPLTITQNSDTIILSHDGTDAFIKWLDGYLFLSPDEGTNTNAIVGVQGKGTGRGFVYCYDQDDAEYLSLSCINSNAVVTTGGLSPGTMQFQYSTATNILCWPAITSGNPYFYLYGRDTGASANKYCRINIDSGGATQIEAQSGESIQLITGGSNSLTIDNSANVVVSGSVRANGGFDDNGSAGIDTTFLDQGGNTITVSGGIITSKVAP